MPTGYTAPVIDGKITDFPTFAMECARAFGALIMMRDDPPGAPIRDKFEPEPHYRDRVETLRAELATLRLGDCERTREMYESEMRDRERSARDSRERAELAKSRCLAMLDSVEAWTPPTPDHAGLKEFMIEQLRGTIKFDGDTDAQWHLFHRIGFSEWREKRIADAEKSLERAEKSYREEIDRAKCRTKWVRDLRESLRHHGKAAAAEPTR